MLYSTQLAVGLQKRLKVIM